MNDSNVLQAIIENVIEDVKKDCAKYTITVSKMLAAKYQEGGADVISVLTEERLAKVSTNFSGFICAASLIGVTGARQVVSGSTKSLVEPIRSISQTPVAVGLGVSNKEQAKEVASYADGVTFGSAFINIIQ